MSYHQVGIILAAISLVLGQGASVEDSNKGFKQVKSVRLPERGHESAAGVSSIKQSIYYSSIDTVAWTGVAESCVDFLGPAGTPLYIETPDEWDELAEFLSPIETALFWTGCEWNRDQSTVYCNDYPFCRGCAEYWDDGHPNNKSSSAKVLLYRHTSGIRLRTASFFSELHYFICELEDITPPSPTTTVQTTTRKECLIDRDLVIILDGSSSIGAANFAIGLEYVAYIAGEWLDRMVVKENRISFIIYGFDSTTIFSLDNTMSIAEIRDAILNVSYPSEPWTNTHLGLGGAFREFDLSNKTNPKNALLLTGGVSTSPSQTLEVAQGLREGGVEIFVVGVGSDADMNELLEITGNKPDHVIGVDGLADLVELIDPIGIIC